MPEPYEEQAQHDRSHDIAPGVQPLAQRARGYIEAFTGGDPAMQRALARLRELPLPDDLAGWNAELLDYLYQALEALPPAEDGRVC